MLSLCLSGFFKEARPCRPAIRSDNGVPFASAHAFIQLEQGWRFGWLRLGIGIERIKPGHPQQNGRHERMHLTLKERSHQASGSQFFCNSRLGSTTSSRSSSTSVLTRALDMKCPAEVYQPSQRGYTGLPGHRLSTPR